MTALTESNRAEIQRLKRIAEAAHRLVDGYDTPRKSSCPHCGDGRTAVTWLSDMIALAEALTNSAPAAVSAGEEDK